MLLRIWAGGALTHMMRLRPVHGAKLTQLDADLRNFLGHLLGTTLTDDAWAQPRLPLRSGGLGLPDLATLADAAYLGSLAQTLAAAAADHGISTEARLRATAPALTASAAAAGGRLRAKGANPPSLQEFLGQPQKGVQRALTHAAADARCAALLDALPVDQKAWVQSCAGPGAGAWPLPPRGKQESFDDTSFLVALRLRLRLLNFQGLYAVVLGPRPAATPTGGTTRFATPWRRGSASTRRAASGWSS